MKKVVYIISFTFLGFLLQILVHAGIEIGYIRLLEIDFNKYTFGLSWEELLLAPSIGGIVLVLAVGIFGFWQGTYWWRRLYVNRKIK